MTAVGTKRAIRMGTAAIALAVLSTAAAGCSDDYQRKVPADQAWKAFLKQSLDESTNVQFNVAPPAHNGYCLDSDGPVIEAVPFTVAKHTAYNVTGGAGSGSSWDPDDEPDQHYFIAKSQNSRLSDVLVKPGTALRGDQAKKYGWNSRREILGPETRPYPDKIPSGLTLKPGHYTLFYTVGNRGDQMTTDTLDLNYRDKSTKKSKGKSGTAHMPMYLHLGGC